MKRLPVPPPLVLSRRRPHADGSGVCASRLDYQTLPLRLCADGHSVLGHNGQFSASIVILSEDLRYAQNIRERPGLWSREAVMSRHDLAAVPMAAVRSSAQALGVYALISLDCHTILAYPYTGTQGSFQRVSALRSSHLGCSVAMPLGQERRCCLSSVSPVYFGAKHVVVWLATVVRYDLPSSVVLDFSPYIPGWLPHGGCDPPALISGLVRPCGI